MTNFKMTAELSVTFLHVASSFGLYNLFPTDCEGVVERVVGWGSAFEQKSTSPAQLPSSKITLTFLSTNFAS